MTIGFLLNGREVICEAEPNERLIDILREKYHLTGAKSACHSGQCGCCAIFFNREITPSCLIPAFRARGAEIVTVEGFAESENYRDITGGFSSAGVENCGYCDAGKILMTESLLSRKTPVDRDAIVEAFDSIKCRCTDAESLVNGVNAAAELRKRRLRDAARS
jgi:carbon-monoxide dehydrogenase small subunit